MLSRTAERLYWFARYLERAEDTARLLLVRHQLNLDLPAGIAPPWSNLLQVISVEEAFAAYRKRPTETNINAFFFADRSNPSSIISSIASARENMRTTREVMPSEVWERVNTLYNSLLRRANRDFPRADRHRVLTDVVMKCQLIAGTLNGTMSHDDAFQFLLMGQFVERCDMTSRIVDVGTASLLGSRSDIQPYCNTLWIAVMRSLSAYQMYRLNIRRRVEAQSVLEFLFESDVFPRSLRFGLDRIEEAAARLPGDSGVTEHITDSRNFINVRATQMIESPRLHANIDKLQMKFDQIHTAIRHTWFCPEPGHLPEAG